MKHKFKVGDKVIVTEVRRTSVRHTTGVVSQLKQTGYAYRVKVADNYTSEEGYEGELFDEKNLRPFTKLDRAMK